MFVQLASDAQAVQEAGRTRTGIANAATAVVMRAKFNFKASPVDKAFTSFDEYETRDDKSFLQILERSKYFDYVNASHGWYADVIGSGRHYRIWTENEVIDVVSCEEPVIEPITEIS